MYNIFRSVISRFQSSAYWKDISWLASGTIVAQAITFGTMPLFTRMYSPSDFAIQNLFLQLCGIMAVIATLRLEHFVQLPRFHRDSLRLIQLVLILGLGFTIITTPIAWFFRDTLARWAGDLSLAKWLVFVPVSAAAMSLGLAVQGGAQRQRGFKRSAESEVVSKLGHAGSIFVGYWVLPGAGGLVLSGLLGSVVKICWLIKGSRRFIRTNFRQYLFLAASYWKMGGSLIVSHVLLAITTATPTFFIANAYGSDSLGQFGLAFQMVCLPTVLIGNAIGNVYYQRASERWAQGRSFGDLWWSTSKKLLIWGIPIYGLFALLMPWLIPFVFGKAWYPAGHYGAVLAISAFFSFATTPMDRACLVVGAWRYVPLWHAARALATLLVTGIVRFFELSMEVYIYSIVIQQIILYVVDYYAEWRFAHQSPPHFATAQAIQ